MLDGSFLEISYIFAYFFLLDLSKKFSYILYSCDHHNYVVLYDGTFHLIFPLIIFYDGKITYKYHL